MYEVSLRNKGESVLLHRGERQVLVRAMLDIQAVNAPTQALECIGEPLRTAKEFHTDTLQIAA